MKQLFSKQNRALLSELVRTDFKLRYQGSILGYAWSLLKPLFMFLILYLVFAVIFKIGKDIPHYPIYLLTGIVLWNFFAEITQQSLISIVARGDLIRKIRIPRWLIILSASFGALINMLLNLVIIFVFAVLNKVDFSWHSSFIFVFIFEIYLFGLGLSLFLSALYVKYRDISYVWDVLLQAGFYVTPILYPITLIADHTIQKILLSNPMAQAIQGARNSFVTPESLTISEVWASAYAVAIPLAIITILLILGILYFKKESKFFAENI